jgi:hypothetical protein
MQITAPYRTIDQYYRSNVSLRVKKERRMRFALWLRAQSSEVSGALNASTVFA